MLRLLRRQWGRLSNLGVTSGMERLRTKQIRITNQLSFVAFVVLLLSWPNTENMLSIEMVGGIALPVITYFLVLVLNAKHRHMAARLLLTLGIYLGDLLTLLTGFEDPNGFIMFYIDPIFFAMIIYLVWDVRHDNKWIVGGLIVWNLLFLIGWDALHMKLFENVRADEWIAANYYDYIKLPQLVLAVAVHFFFLIMNRTSSEFDKALTVQTAKIERKNRDLQEAYEEIAAQNEEITGQNKVLEERQHELTMQQEELQTQNEALHNAMATLKETQGQLVQAEKMASLGQLTAGIAHELNNPINSIQSGLAGLQQGMELMTELHNRYTKIEPDRAAQQLEEITRYKTKVRFEALYPVLKRMPETIQLGATRAAAIVKGLRTFSRLDEYEMKPVDLHENLESTIALLQHQLKDKVFIERLLMKSPPLVECHAGQLNQVFMHLLTNAIHAIEQRPEELVVNGNRYLGKISVSSYSETIGGKPAMGIAFADTGEGMVAEVRQAMFDPFFTTKPVGQGAGLGLAVVSGIVKAHNGTVSVESTAGSGTQMVVVVPLAYKGK